MSTCTRCNEVNPERARFCLGCGALLERTAGQGREVRKVVTLVFTDVSGSTALGEELDPESLRRVMARYFEAMRAVIAHHGGTVEKFVGDAVLAVFGIPLVHEDDALRAVRAAVEMRAALEDLNKGFERDKGVTLNVRTGINTGEVVAGDLAMGEAFVTGDAVNAAARLEQSAPAGEILLGPQTFRLVKNAVEVEILKPLEFKGKAESFPAFRLISVAEKAAGYSRRLDSPLVGRGYELELLRGAFDRAIREGSCHLFTILGSAGVGKSRLVAEFLREKEDSARVIQGRCLPYGEAITYWPLAEIIKDAARLTETASVTDVRERLTDLLSGARDAERVAILLLQLLGLEQSVATTEELGWASRRMLETMAQGSPLVVVFDDIHWAEAALLDTIEYLADWSRDSSILLLCVARPELLDGRPGWGGGKMNATSILLEPLTAAESDQLVHALLGSARLGTEVTDAVSKAAEGNPLFVEQMLDMLVDEGLLIEETDGWRLSGTIEDIEVPPTIHALISARLDKLKDQERQVIERASVIGKTFSANAVRHLSPGGENDVGKHLMALVRKELIRQSEDPLDDGEGFRFRHIIIRDAAYDSISKETRADMHLRLVRWLEGLKTSETIGFEEILAHHLSEAHRYKRELGWPADELRSIAVEAALQYETSGLRALSRNDYRAAAKLLRHGSDFLDEPLDFARLVLPLAEVLFLQGRSDEALQLLERIEDADDEIMKARIEIVRTSILLSTDQQVDVRMIQETARSSILLFERVGEPRWAARAWSLLADTFNFLGEADSMVVAAEKAVSFAVMSGDRQIEVETRRGLAYAHTAAFTPADEVLIILDEQAEKYPDSPALEGFLLMMKSVMEAMLGDFDAARQHGEQGIQILDELSLQHLAALARGIVGWGEAIAGNHEEACRRFNDARQGLEDSGDTGFLSTFMFELGESLCELERYDEATSAAIHSRDITAPNDVVSLAGWRLVLARTLIERGEKRTGHKFLAEAEEIIREMEASFRADLKLQAATVHMAAGGFGKAQDWLTGAREDYVRKGATALVATVDEKIELLQRLRSS